MVKIYLTPQAKTELVEIKKYISLNNPIQAKRVADKIISEIEKIPSNLTRGRPVVVTNRFTLRQLLVYKYRIFYREMNGMFQVISIYHTARLLKNNPGIQHFFDKE